MKPGPKISEISDKEIKDLLIIRNLNDFQVAEIFGVSRSTIALRRKKLNIPPKPKNKRKTLSLDQEKILCNLYAKGLNDYEVAAKVHLGRDRLRKWREEHDIKSKGNKKGLKPYLCKTILQRHKNGESFDKIAKDFHVNRTSLIRLLKKNSFNYESKRRITPTWVLNYKLTNLQKSVLVGDLFGDGHIESSSARKAYYSCAHKKDQETFVVWKFNMLKPLSNRLYFGDQKNRDPSRGREAYVSMSTWSSTELKIWHKKIYPLGKGNKRISPLLVNFLDPLGLAVWYMGDGSLSRKTGTFTIDKSIDFNPICSSLNNKFGVMFKAKLYEKQWTMTVIDPDAFFKLICPYIIDSMKYKIPKKYHYLCDTTPIINFGLIYNNKKFNKKDFMILKEEEKVYLINDTVEYYIHRGFPYPKYSEKEQKSDFNSLISSFINSSDENFLKCNNAGVKLCNHFFPHRFDTARYNGCAMAIWRDRKLFKKFIENRFKYFNGPFSDKTIRTGIALKGLPANFNPSIAKYIYDNYLSDDGKTLDFSAGFGGRLLGYIASSKGSMYVGVEPLTKSYRSLLKMASICTWNNLNIKSIEIKQSPFEDLKFERDSFDLIFSSPPYYGLEIYGDEHTQSINRYPEYKDWLNSFWYVVINNCFNYLKNKGHFIFSLSNYKKYDLIGDTMKFIKRYSFQEKSSLKITYHNVYKNRDKFENLFIFMKEKQ